MRISAPWFGSTVGSNAWKDVATIGHWKRAPPRVVFSSLCSSPPGAIAHGCCPAEQKRRVVIVPFRRGLILMLRSLVSCVWG
jgi:hypothetical protein